jgi:hypothetical protein
VQSVAILTFHSKNQFIAALFTFSIQFPRLDTDCIIQIYSPYGQNGTSAAKSSCHTLDQSWLFSSARNETYIMKHTLLIGYSYRVLSSEVLFSISVRPCSVYAWSLFLRVWRYLLLLNNIFHIFRECVRFSVILMSSDWNKKYEHALLTTTHCTFKACYFGGILF